MHTTVTWFLGLQRSYVSNPIPLPAGSHARQDSMEPSEAWGLGSGMDCHCEKEILKPLERRKQRHNRRCLAHSLVGTPNYIAPEVLLRQGKLLLLMFVSCSHFFFFFFFITKPLHILLSVSVSCSHIVSVTLVLQDVHYKLLHVWSSVGCEAFTW